jgi:hypothetical protein
LLTTLDTQMMVVVCVTFAGGLLLASLAAALSAASRRSNRLFRITPHAERQFLEELNRTEHKREGERVVTTIIE